MFRNFIGRDAELRKVTRYSLYEVMFYRTNLYTHSHRTASIVRSLNKAASLVFGAKYDSRRAGILALVHDDAEIIFGDIQAGNKSRMTPEQLSEIHQQEIQAINVLAKQSPEKIDRYSYKDLLFESADHSTLESMIVNYADKYDAYGEALHEIFAGNQYFTTHVINEYGKIPTPPEYYVSYFGKYLDKFPAMTPLLEMNLPVLQPFTNQDYTEIVSSGTLHTPTSLKLSTGHHHYDTWRRIVLADTNIETVSDLYSQKEFSNII